MVIGGVWQLISLMTGLNNHVPVTTWECTMQVKIEDCIGHHFGFLEMPSSCLPQHYYFESLN